MFFLQGLACPSWTTTKLNVWCFTDNWLPGKLYKIISIAVVLLITSGHTSLALYKWPLQWSEFCSLNSPALRVSLNWALCRLCDLILLISEKSPGDITIRAARNGSSVPAQVRWSSVNQAANDLCLTAIENLWHITGACSGIFGQIYDIYAGVSQPRIKVTI